MFLPTTMASHLLLHARRLALSAVIGITGFATYRARTDPVHLFWDLDHTILCSISPLPKYSVAPCDERINSATLSPSLEHFDQIDDDFPYNPDTLEPNTRTYIRPGARIALRICSYFGILHVYTAAQESYTSNILNRLDPNRTIFTKVIHRDDYPAIVSEGKDLAVAVDRLERAILFDDKQSNFKPQLYQNGVGVSAFTPDRVEKCLQGDYEQCIAYYEEMREMARLVFIAFCGSVHLSGDVRDVVGWVRGIKNGN